VRVSAFVTLRTKIRDRVGKRKCHAGKVGKIPFYMRVDFDMRRLHEAAQAQQRVFQRTNREVYQASV
jgi:hypothetical protein